MAFRFKVGEVNVILGSGPGILPVIQCFLRELFKALLLIDNYYRLRYYRQFVIGTVGIGQVNW